jgi:hypothetical protein
MALHRATGRKFRPRNQGRDELTVAVPGTKTYQAHEPAISSAAPGKAVGTPGRPEHHAPGHEVRFDVSEDGSTCHESPPGGSVTTMSKKGAVFPRSHCDVTRREHSPRAHRGVENRTRSSSTAPAGTENGICDRRNSIRPARLATAGISVPYVSHRPRLQPWRCHRSQSSNRRKHFRVPAGAEIRWRCGSCNCSDWRTSE